MRRLAVALVLVLAALPAPARAGEVTGSQLRDLAQQAAEDPAALEQLRRVDRVDGRPVRLDRAVAGRAGAERARTLGVLLAGAAPAAPADDRARARAQEILSDSRYRESSLPRPFRRPLEWLGDRARPVLDAISDGFESFARWVPGGRAIAWLLLGLAVGALAVLASRAYGRRRATGAEPGAAADSEREDPAALERAAAQAEAAGEWERAVRLRFRAGLARLGEPPSRTTGELAARLHSPDFDALGTRFDAIAYGGDPAVSQDADHAREGWPRVLEQVR